MPELTIHRGGDTARVPFSGTPVLDEVLRMRLSAGIHVISMFPNPAKHPFSEEYHA